MGLPSVERIEKAKPRSRARRDKPASVNMGMTEQIRWVDLASLPYVNPDRE
ncbi:MAG: hypothetical protein ACI9NC_002522 [Verrucomicrobiales bacterium]|jgi:hypothetical protein